MTTYRFQASWDSWDQPSFVHLVGPRESGGHTDQPYIVLYLGGHDGVRISIPTATDADELSDLLGRAADRFRTSTRTGLWSPVVIEADHASTEAKA
jgi:hypothetical protein